MFRFRVQTVRTLLWLGNLVVLVAIGLLLTNIAMNRDKITPWMEKDDIEKHTKAPGTIEVGSQTRLQNWSNYNSLWQLNVTGKEPPKVDTTTDETTEVLHALKPLEEVIFVTQVVGPTASIHYVEDGLLAAGGAPPTPTGRGGVPTPGSFQQDLTKRHVTQVAEDLITVGHALRPPYDGPPFHSKLLKIGAEGLRFQWGEEEVVINVGKMAAAPEGVRTMPTIDDESGEVVPGRSAGDPGPIVSKQRESRMLNEDSWFIGTEERDRIAEEHTELLSEIRVTTHFDSDRKHRVRLSSVPPGSLAFARGFREGDLLRKINGEEIISKKSIVQNILRNPSAGTIRIEIERDGLIKTKVFKVAR